MNRTNSPKRNRALAVALIVLSALVALFCVVGCLGVVGDSMDDDRTSRGLPAAVVSAAQQPVTPKPKAARALEPADIKLGVKITTKQCFGSAGCNVTFKVTVDVSAELLARSDRDWTVTYEVRGVKDGPQVAELSLHADGTFEQDSFQFGSTPSRGTKLSAKVTDVEPVL